MMDTLECVDMSFTSWRQFLSQTNQLPKPPEIKWISMTFLIIDPVVVTNSIMNRSGSGFPLEPNSS